MDRKAKLITFIKDLMIGTQSSDTFNTGTHSS